MRSVVKRYNCIKKDTVLTKYASWFKEAKAGFPNGFVDIKNRGVMVSKTKVEFQNGYGEKRLSIWLKKYFPSEKNWKLTKLAVLPFLGLEQKLFTGSLSKERFTQFQPYPPSVRFSLVTGRRGEWRLKRIPRNSRILTVKRRRWENSIRQTLWDRDTSEDQRRLPDFTPFIRWMWLDILLGQINSLISRQFPCVYIFLTPGEVLGFQRYPRWIMKWLPLGEGDIPTAFPRFFAFICFWVFIWYLFPRESQEEMLRLRVLMISGRKGYSEGIIVLSFLFLKEPVKDSCTITIMRNHTEAFSKRKMAQGFLEYAETDSGNLLDTCQGDLTLISIKTLGITLISLLQRGRSLLSEKSILTVGSRLTALPTSSGENLRDNMLLLLFLRIERDWLLNMTIGSLNLFLFQLRVVLLLPYFQLNERSVKPFRNSLEQSSLKWLSCGYKSKTKVDFLQWSFCFRKGWNG